ncbi:MAG TPA: peptidoglycan-associated lipoprotein Pal [Candidatus Thiothrix moscowensis]|uniref:peptidoglycan-associated lipoprotein Pal n=1 Tax=unclassified Thiothrix TaxID=2636184 RepID=UPI001A34C430|nr:MULTISPECIES: peptidoglycan-associated lipoprotein Pal [unclassified Thiothrix]MBJ6611076.1 peptidoglycan-associated lipoprotein Pal [Candidatus Thiothrix moscowensis]HRJ52308.1 peptidoglycan-associated lipoprotein Pal [Candidatus Thiothrix moscowensis]HRJ92623.1 peptidoglycan-associated lipoprotein Pal [Candidatus Thiothrix moscowensis]
MKTKALVVSILMSAALLATGCAQQGGSASGGVNAGGGSGYNSGSTGGYNSGSGGYNSGGYNNGGAGGYNGGSGYSQYTPADLKNPSSILAQRIIYFDYDSANIRPEYQNVLTAHASLLSAYPNLRVRLEGHADERGSREYNVALSERRGYSVLDYMQIKGVRSNQTDVIGYGEEIPAMFGHNESAWGKNRRVEIKYPGE